MFKQLNKNKKLIIIVAIFMLLTFLLSDCSEEKKKPEAKPEAKPELVEKKTIAKPKKEKPQPKEKLQRWQEVDTKDKATHIRQGGPNKIYWDEATQMWRKEE